MNLANLKKEPVIWFVSTQLPVIRFDVNKCTTKQYLYGLLLGDPIFWGTT